jgi:predicted transcriptional regulator
VPTTIHLPDELLARVDARARAMKMPRNRYIVEALRKALNEQSEWSPAFLEALDELEPSEGVDELEEAVVSTRTRTRAPRVGALSATPMPCLP